MSDRDAITPVLLQQEAELDLYTASCVGVESLIFENTESLDYATLDMDGKAANTKKLNALTKKRDDLMTKMESSHRRIALTRKLLQRRVGKESSRSFGSHG